ncbi:unnamed protein product [Paramecium pentaurelia]|uniref:Uncharacterized protein n=1 Tax=Paramecium pentaurelia TaxID=43138 RepID=A0A8S1UIY9_9CILI|nr:unnamed protein product [Paramecium pentaurelia]
MKIISFLLIITFTTGHLQLLDDLKQTSFGQSLEQTILLQLQYDENKLKSILQEIYSSMNEEQIIDDANFRQEYENCNSNDLQNDIIAIKYEESSIKQKMKLLNNSFELQVSQQKQKELQFNQEQLNQYIKQMEQEKENQVHNLKECDELLELLQYLRFQFEKKLMSQLSNQKSQYLLQLKQEIQDQIKIINKMIKKQTYNNFIKLLISQFEKQDQNYEKLHKIILQIQEIIEQNRNQIRKQFDENMKHFQTNIQYYQQNIQQIQQEIELLQEQQVQIEKELKYFQEQLNKIIEIYEIKNQLQIDKDNMCKTLAEDYNDYRNFRNSQIQQLVNILNLVERDLFLIKDHYVLNGQLRQ